MKVKFQAEEPDEAPAADVMERFKAIGLPAYVILRPASLRPGPCGRWLAPRGSRAAWSAPTARSAARSVLEGETAFPRRAPPHPSSAPRAAFPPPSRYTSSVMKYFAAAVVVLAGLGALVSAQARSVPTTPPAASSPAKPGSVQTPRPAPTPGGAAPVAARSTAPDTSAADAALVQTYCVACHSDRAKAGGLSLASFDPARAAANAEIAEKVIRKLTAGMMPPVGVRRPEPAVMKAFVHGLETRLDRAAAARPESGLASVSAPDARGVHASRQGSARSRHRRHRVSAARHQQPRLRQRRRRAELLADAVRRLSPRRRVRSAAWPSAIGMRRRRPRPTGFRSSNRRCATSRARRSARAAAWRSRTRSPRTAPTSSA